MKKVTKPLFKGWHNYDTSIVVPIVLLSIFLVVAIALCVYSYNLALQKGVEDYNNGICRECGDSLKYKGSARDRCYRYDYYICPNGHIVEVFKG